MMNTIPEFSSSIFSTHKVNYLPNSVWKIEAREKDIRFFSRTRFNTDMMQRLHAERDAVRRLYHKLPPALRDDPEAKALQSFGCDPHISIAHLTYRQTCIGWSSRDYEFSRPSMGRHWAAGHADAENTLNNSTCKKRHVAHRRVRIYDLTAE